MVEAPDDTCEPTAAQLASWAGEQGVDLDVMRARVAGNRAAMAAAAMRMRRMVEAGARIAPDQAQHGQDHGLGGEDGPVQTGD